jgi:hypothetical protein
MFPKKDLKTVHRVLETAISSDINYCCQLKENHAILFFTPVLTTFNKTKQWVEENYQPLKRFGRQFKIDIKEDKPVVKVTVTLRTDQLQHKHTAFVTDVLSRPLIRLQQRGL